MATLHLIKGTIDVIPFTDKGQCVYWDDKDAGFGLVIGKKTKTFIAQHALHGKVVRITIGRTTHISVDEARKRAKRKLADLASAIDPRAPDHARTTLQEALDLYLADPVERRPSTVVLYKRFVTTYLKPWLTRPLRTLSRAECRVLHQKIGKQHGPYCANLTFKFFTAIWNRLADEDETLPKCPAVNVRPFPERKRKGIELDQLARWYREVLAIPNVVKRRYLLFLLFTGMRRTAAAEVKWSDIDFGRAILHVREPKGGPAKAFDIPLSTYLLSSQ